MKGQKVLKITSILMISGGIIAAIAGVIAILGAAALAAIGPDALQHEIQSGLARLGIAVERGSSALLDAITPQTVHIAVAVGLAYAGMRLLEQAGKLRLGFVDVDGQRHRTPIGLS